MKAVLVLSCFALFAVLGQSEEETNSQAVQVADRSIDQSNDGSEVEETEEERIRRCRREALEEEARIRRCKKRGLLNGEAGCSYEKTETTKTNKDGSTETSTSTKASCSVSAGVGGGRRNNNNSRTSSTSRTSRSSSSRSSRSSRGGGRWWKK